MMAGNMVHSGDFGIANVAGMYEQSWVATAQTWRNSWLAVFFPVTDPGDHGANFLFRSGNGTGIWMGGNGCWRGWQCRGR